VPPSRRTGCLFHPTLDALVLASLAAQQGLSGDRGGAAAGGAEPSPMGRKEAAKRWALRFPPAREPSHNAPVPLGRA